MQQYLDDLAELQKCLSLQAELVEQWSRTVAWRNAILARMRRHEPGEPGLVSLASLEAAVTGLEHLSREQDAAGKHPPQGDNLLL